MRRRDTRPWPAFVDLFSALFIATFAGFVLLAGKEAEQLEKHEIRKRVAELAQNVEEELGKNPTFGSKVRREGDDVMFDLYVHYETNSDIISQQDELTSVRSVIRQIKRSIDELEPERRKDIEIIIEGHTDRQQANRIEDERTRYLFNWNLSSRRAASLLYEFRQLGVKVPEYAILSIGYADSMPLCDELTTACDNQNRRTTIRLRPDMIRIERRGKTSTSSGEHAP